MQRKHFGEVFEGKKPGEGIPQVTLRRLTLEEEQSLNGGSHCLGECVGVFHGAEIIAFCALEDLFDRDGNRFYND
jgi:hypothetical protein